MVLVPFWLQLLLLFVTLRQSNELPNEAASLEEKTLQAQMLLRNRQEILVSQCNVRCILMFMCRQCDTVIYSLMLFEWLLYSSSFVTII
jgi:hypothetical protein